ncbi:hypothetical protein [Acinetobacter colistiniresistens]|uniref:hypothetical protein n=1 Tax=Acinetobacter colistiniresistens TaxID=280145 RepID=UPI00124FB036|nr:hypothetical protein [Acinetobacter colistiniresistens]
MNTMVVKATGTISNPSNIPVIVSAVVTSDTFSGGNGEILGRNSDSLIGGSPIVWRGFDGYTSARICAINNGTLVFTKDDNYGVVGVDYKLTNLAVQFKVTQSDSGITDQAVFIDVRRVNGSVQVYRLNFYNGNKLSLIYRNASGTSAILATTDAIVNDTILYIVNGSSHKVYVNGILKLDVTHNGYVGEGYVSLSRGSISALAGTVGIDDLTVYSI